MAISRRLATGRFCAGFGDRFQPEYSTSIDINPESDKQDLLNLKMKRLDEDINLTDVEYKAL